MRLALLLLLFFASCSRGPRPVRVLAAASLADVLEDFKTRFAASGGAPIELSFASSSTLARQVQAGVRADVFISAHPRWLDHLAAHDVLVAGSRRDLAGNRLVEVVAAGTAQRPCRRVAMGDPGHVPVGLYAKAAYTAQGRWPEIERKLLPAIDARAALAYVERGEADCGVVYFSDVRAAQGLRVRAEIDPALHPPIRYPAARLTSARRPQEAQRFLDYMRDAAQAPVWERHGFSPLNP